MAMITINDLKITNVSVREFDDNFSRARHHGSMSSYPKIFRIIISGRSEGKNYQFNHNVQFSESIGIAGQFICFYKNRTDFFEYIKPEKPEIRHSDYLDSDYAISFGEKKVLVKKGDVICIRGSLNDDKLTRVKLAS